MIDGEQMAGACLIDRGHTSRQLVVKKTLSFVFYISLQP
jgi:hypothetical protein